MHMKTYECRDCKQEFTVDTVRPGRPPVRCESCRIRVKEAKQHVEVQESITGKELVDRLEFNLKAAGLHISQWRDKYE